MIPRAVVDACQSASSQGPAEVGETGETAEEEGDVERAGVNTEGPDLSQTNSETGHL
jgi:hypothetical protein